MDFGLPTDCSLLNPQVGVMEVGAWESASSVVGSISYIVGKISSASLGCDVCAAMLCHKGMASSVDPVYDGPSI